jgi:hypothetical protein
MYEGDNPLRLANEIDAALAKYGLGNDHRMCKAIHFFEGELRLIAAHQPARSHEFALTVDRRQCIACRESNDLVAPDGKETYVIVCLWCTG